MSEGEEAGEESSHDKPSTDSSNSNSESSEAGGMPDFGGENFKKEGKGINSLSKLRVVKSSKEVEEESERIRREELDLVKRGAALAHMPGGVSFAGKQVRNGDKILFKPDANDENRWIAFEALFGRGEDRPHLDTFRGRLVDHKGEIVDDHYSMMELTKAVSAAGLYGHSADAIKKAFKEWAITVKFNDLIQRFERVIPEWDGISRAETSLLNIFECHDDPKCPLNREFSLYFWLSIYCRVTDPGCYAPMVLCLIGDQFTGKSYFSNIICQTIIGKEKAHATKLTLDGDLMEFLREITGNSIIANVGEMTGYNRGDLNRIKDFITRTCDGMHYKYEGNFEQPRQWIIIMDGNKYEGLQRDETGNRRFYPLFVGENPRIVKEKDENGNEIERVIPIKEKWTDDYCDEIAATIWPIMAECREWMKNNGGLRGYHSYVNAISQKVLEFSRAEMDKDRGTIQDEDLDTFLIDAILDGEAQILNASKNKGYWISSKEIARQVFLGSARTYKVKLNHLPNKMKALGAEKEMIKNHAGYIFRNVTSKDELAKQLQGINEEANKDEKRGKDIVIPRKAYEPPDPPF